MERDFNILNLAKVKREPFKRHFLAEVVAEIRFARPGSIERIVEGLSTEQLKALELDSANASRIQQASITIDRTAEKGPVVGNQIVGIRYDKAESGIVFQLLADRLVWARKEGYEGYESFRSQLKKAVESSIPFFEGIAISRVGLRKIDSLIIGEKSGLEDVLDHFNDSLFGTCRAGLAKADSIVSNDGFRIEANGQQAIIRSSVKKEGSGQYKVTLDFDLAFLNEETQVSAIYPKLDALNDAHFSLFCWAITDKLRGVLNQ